MLLIQDLTALSNCTAILTQTQTPRFSNAQQRKGLRDAKIQELSPYWPA